LEESIKLYEDAMTLSKQCTDLLNEAKLKITQISELEKAEEQ
ncbi:MAG: exodeoxyribonuclease VII small subunit, partial [Clostridia bacterium]|nr:exodeoxyribonuclease VII small subunit [Clostridia bacterium]